MAPTLPLLNSGAAQSSSSSSAGSKSKLDVVVILSSDDEQEASSRKRPSSSPAAAGSKPNVIILSSSDDEQEEASSSWKTMSSSVGSKASGPVVLTSSDSDRDAQLLAACRPRRAPQRVLWLFSDEVRILEALAGERVEAGRPPGSLSRSALLDVVRRRAPDLKREDATAGDVAKKVHNLKERFKTVIAAGGPRDELRQRKLYELSREVWPELLPPLIAHISPSAHSSSDGTCSH